MTKAKQIWEGDWIDVTDGRNCICCDCGLTHKEKYAILEGRILQQVNCDNLRTSIYRRALKRTKEGVFCKKRKNKR